MPRDPNRTRRIESELQRSLSELLRRDVKDPRIGNVTITAVQVSPDLGHARVFYLPFDQSRSAEDVQAGLAGAARFLRGRVGRQLKLRVAPEIHFEADHQLAQGMRLTELIDKAVAQDERRHSDTPDTTEDLRQGTDGAANEPRLAGGGRAHDQPGDDDPARK